MKEKEWMKLKMENFNDVKELLKSLSMDLIEELKKKPFFIVTEADLQGYLYSKLFKKFEDQGVKDTRGTPNFRIHSEYPRYYTKKGKPYKSGKYDLVILRDKFDPDSEYFDGKPVWLGFELKVNWDEAEKHVISDLEDDLPAFTTEERKIPSDLGVIFQLNVAKREPCNFEIIKHRMKEFHENHSKIFFIYVESYYDEREPPKIISFP